MEINHFVTGRLVALPVGDLGHGDKEEPPKSGARDMDLLELLGKRSKRTHLILIRTDTRPKSESIIF